MNEQRETLESVCLKQRKALEDACLELWKQHHRTYQTVVLEYGGYLKKRRELNIRPLRALSKTLLEQFPDIPLLGCEDENRASKYLSEVSIEILKNIPGVIDEYLSSAIYRALRSTIADYSYQEKTYGIAKTSLGFDPSYYSTHGCGYGAKSGKKGTVTGRDSYND